MHPVLDPNPGGDGGSGSSPKPGDLIADRYQIERFIGRGGMAEVFAGLNVRTGKRVALKWIRPALATTTEALARFRREAVAAGRIHHPNVVTVFDVVEHKSATWLVMELLEGETLSEILTRVDHMEPEAAIGLLIPAMRGVAAAHAHGVVHRDIKPDNIFICRAEDGHRPEAKVLDFGVSKLADESADQVSITVTGSLVGTPTYMPPEQVRGTKVVDLRSDIYALGVVLYQMLAGRTPFQGKIYSALMIEIATTDPPMLRSLRPDLPVELEKIVHKAMARDIEDRYSDVTSFVHALEDLVGGEVSHTPPALQSYNSGAIRLAGSTRGSGPIVDRGDLPVAPKEDTLKVALQRIGNTKVLVIAVAALVVVVIGVKVLTTTRTPAASTRASASAPRPPEAARALAPTRAAEPPPPAPPAAAQLPPSPMPEANARENTRESWPAREAPQAGRSRGGHTKVAAAKDKASEAVPEPLEIRRPTPSATAGSRAGRLSIDDF
jgi:serine/threonine protein kinase